MTQKDSNSSQQNPTQDRSMSRFEVLKKNAETTKLEAARAKKRNGSSGE